MRLIVLAATVSWFALVCASPAQDLVLTNVPLTLVNKSFERPSILVGAIQGAEPKPWFYFSSNAERRAGVTDVRKKSGLQSVVFKAQSGATNYQGLAQRFRARRGLRYGFSVAVMPDQLDRMSGDSCGQISLEWQDAAGKEISRTWGPRWTGDSTPGRWEKFLVESDPPTNAALGVAVITFFACDPSGTGSFYVDDCELSALTPEQ